MGEISIIGLDLAKQVFQVHGARVDGSVVLRKKLTRGQLLAFFSKLPPCIVAMEACATAHYWAREIGEFGHEIRLVPPAYVKPFGSGRKMTLLTRRLSLRLQRDRRCVSLNPRHLNSKHAQWSSGHASYLSVNEPKR